MQTSFSVSSCEIRVWGLLILAALLFSSTRGIANVELEFRVDDSPYLDLSWNLPRALLLGNHDDYSLFFSLAKSYRACNNYAGLQSPQRFQQDLGRVLLDSPEKRRSYYKAAGREFGSSLKRASERELRFQYAGMSVKLRRSMAGKLQKIYNTFLSCDNSAYHQSLEDFQAFLLKEEVIGEAAANLAIGRLKADLAAARQMGLGRYLDTPVRATAVDCSAIEKLPQEFPFPRLVLDPGHFGGDGVTDSREYRGFREGWGTFVVANLAKAYLVKCLGVDSAQIILTRDSLGSIYGNEDITFKNFALMDYRTELIAFLEPDAVISIHTDGGAQTVKAFSPGVAPVYYYYRHLGDVTASSEVVAISADFSRSLVAGVVQQFQKSTAVGNRVSLLSPGKPPQTYLGRSKVFQNVLDRDIPLVLLEGLSHESEEMVSELTDEASMKETFQVGLSTFHYSPVLRWYAEGIVCGIVIYATAQEHC